MVQAAYPAGKIGTSLDNLKAAAAGEMFEWGTLYPDFAKTAEQEGLTDIAAVFRNIAVAEKQHQKRYSDLVANLEAGRVFKRGNKVVWRCLNCGYLHEGTDAPQQCPACAHPQAYFELLGENW
jgi:rubrerythrin